MSSKAFLLATLAYVAVTFVLGPLWHLALFDDTYQALGVYTREPPHIPLGFTSMIIQGLILAYLYPTFYRGGRPLVRGLQYGLVMGVFLWSVAVLAHAAKSEVSSVMTFITLSSAFHLIQFVITGILIGWIYGTRPQAAS